MDDLISRQQAINALKNDMASLDHIIKGMSGYDVRLDAYVSQRNQVDCDIDTINNLPPAQPELGTNLAEVGTDCISRQQAINALRDYLVEKRCPDDGTLTCRLIENEVINKLPSATDKNVGDTISRKAMIDALHTWFRDGFDEDKWWNSTHVLAAIEGLPPVTPKQPDLSEAYANAVFTWLMSYQIQSAQLKGRYTPYEVIGWVLNDWRKEHDAERDT